MIVPFSCCQWLSTQKVNDTINKANSAKKKKILPAPPPLPTYRQNAKQNPSSPHFPKTPFRQPHIEHPMLPSPDQFLTSLLTLSSHSPNPLAPSPTLLTLHCLFPQDLLPALDLLDHALVTSFALASPTEHASARQAGDDTAAPSAGDTPARAAAEDTLGSLAEEDTLPTRQPAPTAVVAAKAAVYYVRSSRPGRGSTGSTSSYEVRLGAWNCTCPAFAFASFGAEDEGVGWGDKGGGGEYDEGREGNGVGGVGGLRVEGRRVPVCKHLLACVLADWGKALGGVERRVVGSEELAGWVAGWGG